MASRMAFVAFVALTLSSGASLSAQRRGGAPDPPPVPGQTNDPFPQPIVSDEGVIVVDARTQSPIIVNVAAERLFATKFAPNAPFDATATYRLLDRAGGARAADAPADRRRGRREPWD